MLEQNVPILAVRGLTKRFPVWKPWIIQLMSRQPRRMVHAVEDVSLKVERGTTYALVGESGCGKSTIARCIAGILAPTAGTITFMGADITMPSERRDARRRHLQMIFQDP